MFRYRWEHDNGTDWPKYGPWVATPQEAMRLAREAGYRSIAHSWRCKRTEVCIVSTGSIPHHPQETNDE